jgi:hypothetical protein
MADGASDVVIHVGNNLLAHWNRDSRQDVSSQHDPAGSWLTANAIVAMRPLHLRPMLRAGHALCVVALRPPAGGADARLIVFLKKSPHKW